MQELLIKSDRKIKTVPDRFHRYLFHKINTNNRLISILGARGTGKTTLLLQLAKHSRKELLYVALDDLFFSKNTLYSLAEEFDKLGGQLLLLDEVHKYPDWSRELKLIYDDFNDLKIIFTSSSILDIYKSESDLSRRAVKYNLKEMSFREYLLFYENIKLPVLSLTDILKEHEKTAFDITGKIKPLKYFKRYAEVGIYPYYSNNKEEYYQQVAGTINLIMDIDLQSIEGIEYAHVAKLKRLLYVLSSNVPFTPNISKLAEKLSMNRNLLVQALQLLEKAELIHLLYKKNKSISILTKPDKIWMHNTNLSYVISDNPPDTGNMRETFFVQHLSVLHTLSLPDKGDFLANNKYIFEVGGKNKTRQQIQSVDNAYIVKDNTETGIKNIIPLWIFGLLY